MLTEQRICEIYCVDEDDIGAIEDVRFLLTVISLLKEGIEPDVQIENCSHKLRMISGRLQNGSSSDALLALLDEASVKPAPSTMLSDVSDPLNQPYSDEELAEEAKYNLVEVALSRFPNLYIAKAKLHLQPGEYMPGDPLMLAFGNELASQFNEWRASEKLQGRQISKSDPTIVWGYEWSKPGHWIVNVVMYLNLDVYSEPGRFSSPGSLAHAVRNAWAYALSISTMAAQELIEIDAKEYMHCISGGDSIVCGEVWPEENCGDAPYMFADLPSDRNSYKYNFPLKGAAYFETI